MISIQNCAVWVLLSLATAAYAKEPCVPTCPPPRYDAQEQADEQNVFVAPQPQGEVAGESGSFGIRGFSIRIPESTIRFPTLQFPGLVRYRRNAEMISDTVRMPVTNQADIQMQFAPAQDIAGPQSDNIPDDDCISYNVQDHRIDQLAKNMLEMQIMMHQLVEAQQIRNQEPATASLELDTAPSVSHHPTHSTMADELATQSRNVTHQHYTEAEFAQLNQRIRELEALRQMLIFQQKNRLYAEHSGGSTPQLKNSRTISTEGVRHISFSQVQTMQPSKAEEFHSQAKPLANEQSSQFADQLEW